VILWELLTQEVPYGDLDGLVVGYQVSERGLRLPIPPGTPPAYAALMRACFAVPEDRPAFSAVLAQLEIMQRDGQCVCVSVCVCVRACFLTYFYTASRS
jgi:hypothetical protein